MSQIPQDNPRIRRHGTLIGWCWGLTLWGHALVVGILYAQQHYRMVWVVLGSMACIGVGGVVTFWGWRRMGKELAIQHQMDRELQNIFDNTPIIMIMVDGKGRITRANKAAAQLLKYSTDKLVDKMPGEVLCCAAHKDAQKCGEIPECQNCPLRQSIEKTWKTGNSCQHVEAPMRLEIAGMLTNCNFLISTIPVRVESQKMVLVCLHDISDRKKAEDELQKVNQFLSIVIENANVWVSSLDRNFNHVLWNSAAERISGYPRDEVLGHHEVWKFLCPDPEQRERIFQQTLKMLESGTVQDLEVPILTRSGEQRMLSLFSRRVYDSKGDPNGVVNVALDITERCKAEDRLRFDSMHDTLTGLPNRKLFLDRLEQCLARSKRNNDYQFAVLFVDLDRFKLINDSLGHAAGDELLNVIARGLRHCIRDSDMMAVGNTGNLLARLGGDEFTILLDDIHSPEEASRVAVRLLEQFKAPYHLGGHDVTATMSIGIVLSNERYANADQILRDADTAMYRAKAQGKACFVIFDQAMHEQAELHLQLEMDLRKALVEKQFEVFYQPLISLETGELSGFEALIRWRHPTKGMVSPADFIPIAEETNLIVPIGKWIMEQACWQVSKWRREGIIDCRVGINVNVSRKQINPEAKLCETVKNALQQTKLPPELLHLEITESIVMQDMNRALTMLHDLKTLGIKIDIDDFGTGYSSLACLHRFPLDGLKIDRAFIANLTDSPEYIAIVQAIVTLTHNLSIRVTAEGIETRDQLFQLQALDCDMAQGYYLARPMPVDDVENFLRHYKPFSQLAQKL